MQAVILAAGMGRRLKEHTKDKTKCMVNVGGQTIIERGLRILDAKGLSRIVIVTGYKSEGLTEHVNSLKLSTPVVYINNSEYENTIVIDGQILGDIYDRNIYNYKTEVKAITYHQMKITNEDNIYNIQFIVDL